MIAITTVLSFNNLIVTIFLFLTDTKRNAMVVENRNVPKKTSGAVIAVVGNRIVRAGNAIKMIEEVIGKAADADEDVK